jgi:hypothetical protein
MSSLESNIVSLCGLLYLIPVVMDFSFIPIYVELWPSLTLGSQYLGMPKASGGELLEIRLLDNQLVDTFGRKSTARHKIYQLLESSFKMLSTIFSY